MKSLANRSNRPFQDVEFDPPSLDRRGHPIDYQPSCLVSRMGSTAPSLKKLMRTPAAPTIVTRQSPKCKVVLGVTQKATTGKDCRTRPSASQVNDSYFPQTDVQLSDPIFSQLLSIASQSSLGAGLLSQTLDSTPTKPLLADPQQEPILMEVTDAFTTAENVNFSLMLVEVFSLIF